VAALTRPFNRFREYANWAARAVDHPKDSGFGTFLEYMQARGIGFSHPAEDDLQSRIVAVLDVAKEGGVADLLTACGSPPLSELLRSLEVLEQFGLVVRRPNGSESTFSLSPAGGRTARALAGGG
jgi:hypothetical protein